MAKAFKDASPVKQIVIIWVLLLPIGIALRLERIREYGPFWGILMTAGETLIEGIVIELTMLTMNRGLTSLFDALDRVGSRGHTHSEHEELE
jgi:hypothetical protein